MSNGETSSPPEGPLHEYTTVAEKAQVEAAKEKIVNTVAAQYHQQQAGGVDQSQGEMLVYLPYELVHAAFKT